MLLKSALLSMEPLSQVVFVHDYVQFRFQDTCLSLYSALSIGTPKGVLHRTDQGFCDALVELIGQRVASVDYRAEDHLQITFAGGGTLNAMFTNGDAVGPELFQLDRPGMPTIVEQVA
jgi:hypothetical protein